MSVSVCVRVHVCNKMFVFTEIYHHVEFLRSVTDAQFIEPIFPSSLSASANVCVCVCVCVVKLKVHSPKSLDTCASAAVGRSVTSHRLCVHKNNEHCYNIHI